MTPEKGINSDSPLPNSRMTSLERRGMLALLLAVTLATLDTAIANTALPTIAADLDTTPAASVWIINGYQLAMVATLLPFAALGGIVGHRRVYLCGLIVFTIASAACAFAWSLPSLVAARLLQGLGASAIMSVNTALISAIFVASTRKGRRPKFAYSRHRVCGRTNNRFHRAFPWYVAVALRRNLPIGVAALMIAWPALPQTERSAHRFDRVAATLNVIAFASFVFALGDAAQRAPLKVTIASLAVALTAGALMLRRERGHPAPMLPVDLFKRPTFALSAMTAVCSFAAQGLAFVSLPLFFETALGRSQVEAGFLMTPWSALVALMAPIAGRLSDRYAPGLLGSIGLAVMCAGMVSLAALPMNPDTLGICIRMAVCGAGFGFFQSPNLKAFIESAPRERSGGTSGVVATARLVGQATGAALVALCFRIAGTHGPALALSLGAAFAGAASIASGLRLLSGDATKAASSRTQ